MNPSIGAGGFISARTAKKGRAGQRIFITNDDRGWVETLMAKVYPALRDIPYYLRQGA